MKKAASLKATSETKKSPASAKQKSSMLMGKLSSIQPSRAGQDGGSDEAWPSVLRLDSDELAAASALVQLAIQLWSLRKETDRKKWEEEKEALAKRRPKSKKERKKFDKEWNEKLKEGDRFEHPAGYFGEALSLLEQALARIKRPQSIAEFLHSHFGEANLIEKAIARSDQERRVPFRKIFDLQRKAGDEEDIFIPMRDGSERKLTWQVFVSEKGFNDCFWGYAGLRSKEWREEEGPKFEPMKRWVQGREAAKGFPALTEVIYGNKKKRREAAEKWIPTGNLIGLPDRAFAAYDTEAKRRKAAEKWIAGEAVPHGFPPFKKEDSIKRRAEFAQEKWGMGFLCPSLEEDLIVYNRSWWTEYLRDWMKYGIPWEPLIGLYHYRQRSNPKKAENLRGKRGPGRKAKSSEV